MIDRADSPLSPGLGAAIRRESSSGKLMLLADLWSGTAEEFLDRLGDPDIACVRDGESCFIYSASHMSRRYAETAAVIASGDAVRMIAETVRFESAAYPRATGLETFASDPFNLSMAAIDAAMEALSADPDCSDIQSVAASDGAVFLFSSRHMGREHARSLAERMAVRRYDNP